MSNIIDSIQLSGVTYTLSAETSGGGITSGEVQTMIDESISGKVNVSDNEVSGLTVTNEITTNVNYNYGDISDFWIEDTSSREGTSSFTFKSIYSATSRTGNCTIYYYHSSQIISSVSSSSGNFTYQIADGKLHITFNSGYSLYNVNPNSLTYSYYLKSYQGGQSADVIEGSINDAINDTNKRIVENALTGVDISLINGNDYLQFNQYYKSRSAFTQSVKLIDGKTIRCDNGLYVNFSGSTTHTVILNTGRGIYCVCPQTSPQTYADSFNEMSVGFNSDYTDSTTSFTLTVSICNSSNQFSYEAYTYDSTTNTLTANGQSYKTSFTKDGYNVLFTPIEGYRIRSISLNPCKIAGIDIVDKSSYIITSVTTASYNYNGQEVIDDLYANKQDKLSAGTGINITDNVISATGSTSGGSPTVEVTQAEYDALVTAGTVSADTYYIITDAQAGDLTNYYTKTETNTLLGGKADTATTYTKTEVDNAITAATSTKQDTLVSGTNIKTINGETLLGEGNITIEGGSDINVVQTTGTSTADVMSQDAVTTALNNKANKTAAVGGYKFGSSDGNVYLQYTNVNNSNIGSSLYYPKINGKEILTTNSIYATNNYNFQLVETSAITTSISSSSTDAQVPSAKAVNDKLGGLSIVKLTQSAYDALSPDYDANTLYIIVN